MKKLMIALAMAGAAGMAVAQSGAAECQAPVHSRPAWCNGEQGAAAMSGQRWWYGQDPTGSVQLYRYPAWGWVAQNTLPYAYTQVVPHPRTRADRDGDGIRNRRDRYPDDPRYR